MKSLLTIFLAVIFSVFMSLGFYGPRQAEAAVAFNAVSESHTGTSGSTSQTSFTWSHAGSASTKGVVVFVYTISASDLITSVTYGGTTMTRVAGGAAIDNAGEPGRVDTFFLGSSIPAGTQNIVVNRTNNTTIMYAAAMTVTAATNTGVTGIVLLQQDGAYTEQAVNDGSPGSNSLRFAGGYYGGAAPPAVGAASTLGVSIDLGANGASAVYETTAGQGARNIGFTATSDDRAAVHLAVFEDTVPPTVSSIVRVNSSPTSATSVQYTVTFSESVTGVDANDFTLTSSGVTGASVTGVSGTGSTYIVTVGTGSGSGTITLGLTDDDTIADGAANKLGGTGIGNGNFTTGQMYTIDKAAPTATIDSTSPNPTNAGSTLTWHADENGSYDVRVGGTSCGTGTSVASGSYTTQPNTVATTIPSGNLLNGSNSVWVCVVDSASNTGSASSSVTKDVTAPILNVVHIASNNADTTKAVAGNIVIVTFTSSESITTPTVTIAGNSASVAGGPTDWSATRTVLAGDALGVTTFSITSFNDLAGNAGSAVSAVTDSSSVTILEGSSTVIVTLAGSGSGTINSSSIPTSADGITCPGDCTGTYPAGTEVTLMATSDWKSDFVTWTGGSCGTGTSCIFTPAGDAGITATFSYKPLVMMPGPTYYATIQDAYNAATEGAVLQGRDQTFAEDLVFDRTVNVSFNGGNNDAWSVVGNTAISGTVTMAGVAGGSVTISNLIIQ